MVDPELLLANPFNYRIHPRFQQDALAGMLEEVGWVQNIIVNKSTGHVIDGHMRVTLALRNEEPEIPVLFVELTEHEEKLVLATIDPISGLAIHDAAKMTELLDVASAEDKRVTAVLENLKERTADADSFFEDPPELDTIFELREDTIFSTPSKWGIPELRADMMAEIVPTATWDGRDTLEPGISRLVVYGTAAVEEDDLSQQALSFWVNDEKLEVVWANAVDIDRRFMTQKWGTVFAPDFSLLVDDPLVVQMYNIYRSRWVARYWQEVGVKVAPIISGLHQDVIELMMQGIPKNCPVVGAQLRTLGGHEKARRIKTDAICAYIEAIQPQNLVFYGAEHREWLEPLLPTDGPKYTWLPDWHSNRKAKGLIRRTRR